LHNINDNIAAAENTPNEPYDVTKSACHRHQCESAGYITLIRKFCYHTLDDSEVPIHYTVQEAAIVLRYDILLMISHFYDRKGEKSIPEDECPERTGKTEENRRDDGAKKAHQKNGLAADVIRKTAPL